MDSTQNPMSEDVSNANFPVLSRSTVSTILEVPTTIICQRYSDRILILITQIGKIGSLLQVSQSSTQNSFTPEALPAVEEDVILPSIAALKLPLPDPSYQIMQLLGSPPNSIVETLQELYARQIAAIVFHGQGVPFAHETTSQPWEGRAVIVGLALRAFKTIPEEGGEEISEETRQVFTEIMKMVLECRVW